MVLLKRELYRRATGPVMNEEDWWRLVFDQDAKRIYVEHEWDNVNVRGGGQVRQGTAEIDINSFLNEGREGPQHRELFRLLTDLFDNPNAG